MSDSPEKTGNGSDEWLVCRKTGQKVLGSAAVCQEPDNPCKFRSECLIYVLWREREEEEEC